MSIILDKVNYVYSAGSAYEIQALKQIDLQIADGEFIGIIGHTGSGKSTLIQHFNGLMRATSGGIYFNGRDIYEEDRKWVLYFNIRSISYLRRRFSTTSVSDREIRDWTRIRQGCVHLKR